jgi:RecA DNA recombination protein
MRATLPSGSIVEITGPCSSGRTAMLHSILAAATARGKSCAIVDCNNAFDPASAAASGTDLERLLWVQAGGRLDHALKAADLILHGGGFGVVALDLCGIAPNQLLRIPLSYWHRFRLAVEKTSATLVVTGARPIAKSCAALQLEAKRKKALWTGRAPFRLLAGAEFEVASRKPGRIEPAVLRAAV